MSFDFLSVSISINVSINWKIPGKGFLSATSYKKSNDLEISADLLQSEIVPLKFNIEWYLLTTDEISWK